MAVNLPSLPKNPRLLAFFKGFLTTLDGLENYLFWAELQEMRVRFEMDSDPESLRSNAWILYQVCSFSSSSSSSSCCCYFCYFCLVLLLLLFSLFVFLFSFLFLFLFLFCFIVGISSTRSKI